MRTSAEIKEEIDGIHVHVRVTRARLIGAKQELARLENQIRAELTTHKGGGGNPDHIANNLSESFSMARAAVTSDANGLRLVIEMLETSEVHKEVVETLNPLFAELAEAEQAEQAERERIAEADRRVNEAVEAAERRAVESAAKDKDVLAARAELEKLAGRRITHREEKIPRVLTAADYHAGVQAPGIDRVKGPQEDAAAELLADFK